MAGKYTKWFVTFDIDDAKAFEDAVMAFLRDCLFSDTDVSVRGMPEQVTDGIWRVRFHRRQTYEEVKTLGPLGDWEPHDE